MRYWYQQPPAALSESVRTVLVADMLADARKHRVPFMIAGMPAVVVQLPQDATSADAIVLTLFGSPVPADFKPDERYAVIIAFCFRPFVLSGLFDIPAQTLAKGPVDLRLWNKDESTRLRNQLSGSLKPAELIEVLNEFFLQLLEQQRHICDAIRTATDQIMLDSGAENLNQLPDALHLTKRTFQRMFKKYVGISPTEYRRICQFQQSFQQLRERQFDKLSDVAVDNGFSDQSHFVRSFREFSQTTPGKYLVEGLQGK
jgi:AraC-like DNA-binding protein